MSIYALPYPPSVNAIWRNIAVKGRARTVLSKEGREYRETVRRGLAEATPIGGPVSVELRVYRPRRIGDLDNTAKAVLDAVKGCLFHDDSQVVALHMHRFDDKENPRVEVLVLPEMPATPEDIVVGVRRKVTAAMHQRHTDACIEALTDPGATCVCRPPAVAEPLVASPAAKIVDRYLARLPPERLAAGKQPADTAEVRLLLRPTPNVRRSR